MLSLTDERVRWSKAPFDHPQLCVSMGQVGDEKHVAGDGTGQARDRFGCLPVVGAEGAAAPLETYLSLDPFRP